MDLAKGLDTTRPHAPRERSDSGEQELPMNRNGDRLCTLIATGVVALGTVLLASVASANPSVGQGATGTSSRSLDPREASIVSSAGTRALVSIAEARGAIQEKDAIRAREELRKAENLLNVIRSTLPTAIAKDFIWVARRHLEYEDTQQVVPDLVRIDQELILLGRFIPTAEARSHLQKARGFLESGDKQAALDEVNAVEAGLVYEAMDLPISETDAHVSRALSELAIGETEKADLALQEAEKSAQIIVATAREPLMKGSSAAETGANEHTEER